MPEIQFFDSQEFFANGDQDRITIVLKVQQFLLPYSEDALPVYRFPLQTLPGSVVEIGRGHNGYINWITIPNFLAETGKDRHAGLLQSIIPVLASFLPSCHVSLYNMFNAASTIWWRPLSSYPGIAPIERNGVPVISMRPIAELTRYLERTTGSRRAGKEEVDSLIFRVFNIQLNLAHAASLLGPDMDICAIVSQFNHLSSSLATFLTGRNDSPAIPTNPAESVPFKELCDTANVVEGQMRAFLEARRAAGLPSDLFPYHASEARNF